jgi:hypothetical protein
MRTYSFLLIALTALQYFMTAQECVDSSLIDLSAACPLIYAPVCGCDGVTYGNGCEATYYGGVTSYTDGECQPNSGCIDMSGLDFGLCDMFLGYTWMGNGCGPMSGCGYVIGNIDYSPNFYQSPWECQQACGQPATDCINYWQIEQGYLVDCAPTMDPVCGCNGETYSNNCMAYYIGGVTTYSLGDCSQANCMVIPISTNFGDCEMVLGWGRLESGCEMLSGCSYLGQNGFDYSAYFFTNETDCNAGCTPDTACIDTSLINPDIFCIAVIDPVCGCDGVTYNNSCEAANWYGVTSYTPGICLTNVNSVTSYPTWLAYPNPVSDQLTLQLDPGQASYIRIMNSVGEVMSEFKPSVSQTVIETSSWSDGLYFIQVQFGNKAYDTRVIAKAN